MNTNVQAEALTIGFKAEMVDAKVSVVIGISNRFVVTATDTFRLSSVVSINGHSLSAINPDVLIGGEATLIAA